MSTSRLKRYPVLPVFIVEDHHEVVPYIHKAIGSKHLPVSGNVLIHYDSHPDLLIPSSLKADDVYNKEVLYDNSSIENWIIPLVYAGHISEVYWIKPPWCDQIKDKTVQFCVGKSKTDGFIRTSCKENYFVSEILYMSEEEMTDKQYVTLTVVTVWPKNWSDISNTIRDDEKSTNECDTVEVLCTCKTNRNYESQIDCISEVPHGQEEISANKNPKNGDGNVGIDEKCHCFTNVCENSPSNKDEPPFKKVKSEELHLNLDFSENVLFEDFVKELVNMFEKLKDRHIILDIDLDFFSTKNPFREMYSEKQYQILSQLYQFDKPVGESDEEIKNCVCKREKQLSELKSDLLSIKDGKDLSQLTHWRKHFVGQYLFLTHGQSYPKKDLIHDLVTDLRMSGDHVDYELLHEAGCTCDDTELPHHVSSKEQITCLVDAVQEVLCHMQKPTIITMARSSNDDYCPPDQVDFIQEKVTEMLKDLYLEISVTEDYEINDLESVVT